jgi:excinuclease UvrABC nuclease subunit
MRRCVEDLHPDPAFPGCIYSEMKMCLAPCFKGCSDEEYASEVKRVQTYFDSGGQFLFREFSHQREVASEALAFEDAAAIHTRVEKLKPILGQLPEIVQRLDGLSALMIQPSHVAGCVTFFRIEAGRISGPIRFSIQPEDREKSHSMESRVHQAMLTFPPAEARSSLEAMEHIAMLKRWYYRGSRSGEIFFGDRNMDLPMRRVVRGISRIFHGEQAQPEIGTPPNATM